jgi:succinyl-diaminopimelate desuccinylase
VVAAVKNAVKEITGKEARAIGIGGGTVAACFREKKLPAVCWTNLDETLHQPNEYSKIDNIVTDARVFAHIFMQN